MSHYKVYLFGEGPGPMWNSIFFPEKKWNEVFRAEGLEGAWPDRANVLSSINSVCLRVLTADLGIPECFFLRFSVISGWSLVDSLWQWKCLFASDD